MDERKDVVNEVNRTIPLQDGVGGMLRQVQDSIASGKVPGDTAVKKLTFAYGRANGESKCPCGSGGKYADCCKREYQAAVRGVKGLEKEQKTKPEPQRDAPVETDKRPQQDVRWCCRVGIDRKTGEPVTDTTGMEMDDPKTSPQQIAGILLMAYHDLMASGAFMLANGVYNRVMHDLGASQAGQHRRRPANRPVK